MALKKTWSLSDLWMVLYRPKRVFEALGKRKNAFIYILLLCLLFALPTWMAKQRITDFAYQQLTESGYELTDQQKDQIVNSGFTVAVLLKVLSRGGVIVGGGLILWIINLVKKYRKPASTAFIFAALCMMPQWLGEMLKAILAIIFDVNQRAINFGLGAFIPVTEGRWWSFLFTIDPFMIWAVILLLCGFSFVFLDSTKGGEDK